MNLPKVTLCAVACTKVDETIFALKQSMKEINYHEVILLTHQRLELSDLGIKVIKIKKLNYKEYNYFILYRLKDYIKSDYCLLVQNDGYVLRSDKWTAKFLKYDYIGAPWAKNVHFMADGKNVRVGNGGFSFRSRKLLSLPTKLKLRFTDKGTGYFHEDGFICVYYRKVLEKHGLKIAPVKIAAKFSCETICPESERYSFGFHKKRNIPKLFFLRPILKKFRIEI
jgi:hypothetical protein